MEEGQAQQQQAQQEAQVQAQAAAVAAVPHHIVGMDDDLVEVLTARGLAMRQQFEAIVAEGLGTIEHFGVMRTKGIAEMAKGIVSLPQGEGGVRVGQVAVRKMEALVFWAKDEKRRVQEINAAEFAEEACEECLTKMDVEEECEQDETTRVKSPGKFEKFKQWPRRSSGLRKRTAEPISPISSQSRHRHPSKNSCSLAACVKVG